MEYSHNPLIKDLIPSRSYSAIIKKANKINLKMRRGNLILNSKFFENLNEKSATIAGFIAADGYVNFADHYVEITLKKDDKSYLQKILNLMECNGKIYVSGNRARIKIVNQKLVDDLLLLNITQAKSKTLKFPLNLESKLSSHFIRGYFDGDGSIIISMKRISILGTLDFLSTVSMIIAEQCSIKRNKPSVKENIYDLRYHGKTALVVLNWLYKDSVLSLDRKEYLYNRFKEMYNK
ncbi:MAG: hypothetical protein EOL97_14760 [Spirochaetia bacterium]|nr:hypothetical protein [Spirochaetia bacterium]